MYTTVKHVETIFGLQTSIIKMISTALMYMWRDIIHPSTGTEETYWFTVKSPLNIITLIYKQLWYWTPNNTVSSYVSLYEHLEAAVGGEVGVGEGCVGHWAAGFAFLHPTCDGIPFICVAVWKLMQTVLNLLHWQYVTHLYNGKGKSIYEEHCNHLLYIM